MAPPLSPLPTLLSHPSPSPTLSSPHPLCPPPFSPFFVISPFALPLAPLPSSTPLLPLPVCRQQQPAPERPRRRGAHSSFLEALNKYQFEELAYGRRNCEGKLYFLEMLRNGGGSRGSSARIFFLSTRVSVAIPPPILRIGIIPTLGSTLQCDASKAA